MKYLCKQRPIGLDHFVEKFAKNMQFSCKKKAQPNPVKLLRIRPGKKVRIHMRQRMENTYSTVVRKPCTALDRASKYSPHQIFHDGELLRVAGGVLQLRLLQIFGRLLRPKKSINQSTNALAFHRKTMRIQNFSRTL